MTVRDARPEDAEAIAAYWNPQIRDTAITFTTVQKDPDLLAAEITERQGAGRAFVVVCDGAQIVGHATYFPFRSGPGYARTAEHTVILAPQARGQGRGRALMAAIEDHARRGGLHSMIGAISGDNPGAIAFHERVGYRRVGTVPQAGWKFGRWMDLVLMQKLL